MKIRISVAPLALCICTSVLAADPNQQEIAAIGKSAEAFVAAYHKGDAKALAEFWTVDGDYVDENGRVAKGREAIEKSFTEFFAGNKDAKVRIDVANIKFPTPELAVEDGTSTVLPADGGAPSRARYTNVLVKKDGKWLLSSVREAAYADPSNYEHLKGLEWMIGDWIEDTKAGKVGSVNFAWAPGQNFIIATRAVNFQNSTLQNGVEWIGWDAATRQIKSWSFEADGGVSKNVWSSDGGKWTVKTEAILANGSKLNSTGIVEIQSPDSVQWRLTEQSLDGKPLPDTKPVILKRAQ